MNEDENVIWRGLEARIERTEDKIAEHDDLLNGNRSKKLIGLSQEQDRMDLELRKINAVLFQDSTGQKGMIHDVDFLMGRRKYDNQSRELIWKFVTEVVIKMLALVGVLLLGWDKLEGLYKKIIQQKPSPLEQKIEQAKHPKSPKKLYRYRTVVSTHTEESPQSP